MADGEDMYLCPTVCVARKSREPVETAADFCRVFRAHRFGVVATSAEEAAEAVGAVIRNEDLAPDANKEFRGQDSIGTSVLFPLNATPIGTKKVYIHHAAMDAGIDKNGERVMLCYRSMLAASDPVMADYMARELAGAIWKTGSSNWADTAIVPLWDPERDYCRDGSVIHLGAAMLDEVRAAYRHTTLHRLSESGATALASKSAERAIRRLEREKLPATVEALRESLDPTLQLMLPQDASRDEVAECLALQEYEGLAASVMTQKDDPNASSILKDFLAETVLHLWKCTDVSGPLAVHAIGAGICMMSQEQFDEMKSAHDAG